MREVLKSFKDDTHIPPGTKMERELLEMRNRMENGLSEMGKEGYIVLQRYNRVGSNYHDYVHLRMSGMLNGHRVVADKSANLEERDRVVEIEKNELMDSSAEENKRAFPDREIYLEIDGEDLSRNARNARKFWNTYSKFAFDIDKAMELQKENVKSKAEEEKFAQGEKFVEDVLF
jgi:hypothetical protein